MDTCRFVGIGRSFAVGVGMRLVIVGLGEIRGLDHCSAWEHWAWATWRGSGLDRAFDQAWVGVVADWMDSVAASGLEYSENR